MTYLKNFIHFFTTISTAILLICTVDIARYGFREISNYITLQILGAAAVTALVSTIIVGREIKTKKQWRFWSILNYMILCVLMNFLGILFGWISPVPVRMFTMALYVAAVYVIVYLLSYFMIKKEADELNHALDERRSREENERTGKEAGKETGNEVEKETV